MLYIEFQEKLGNEDKLYPLSEKSRVLYMLQYSDTQMNAFL